MEYSKINTLHPYYHGKFVTTNNDVVEWYIYREGEAPQNSVELTCAADAMEIEYSSEGIYQPRKCSKLRLSVVTPKPLLDIVDGIGYKTRIVVFMNEHGTTDYKQIYYGFYTSEEYTQELHDSIDVLELEFVDILSVLENITFEATTNMRSFGDILQDVISIQGDDQGITDFVVHQPVNKKEGWWEHVDPYRYWVNESAFVAEDDTSDTDTCAMVLESIALWLNMTFVYHGDKIYLIDYSSLALGEEEGKAEFISFFGDKPRNFTQNISKGALHDVGIADGSSCAFSVGATYTDFKVIATRRDKTITDSLPEWDDLEHMYSVMEDGMVEPYVNVQHNGDYVSWDYGYDNTTAQKPYYTYIVDKFGVKTEHDSTSWTDKVHVVLTQFLWSNDWRCGDGVYCGTRMTPTRLSLIQGFDFANPVVYDNLNFNDTYIKKVNKYDIIPCMWGAYKVTDTTMPNDWNWAMVCKQEHLPNPCGLWADEYPFGERPGSMLGEYTGFIRYADYKAAEKPSQVKWETCLAFYRKTTPYARQIQYKPNTNTLYFRGTLAIPNMTTGKYEYSFNQGSYPSSQLSVSLAKNPYLVINGGGLVISFKYMLGNFGIFPTPEAFKNYDDYTFGMQRDNQYGLAVSVPSKIVFRAKCWIVTDDGETLYFNGSEWVQMGKGYWSDTPLYDISKDEDGNWVFNVIGEPNENGQYWIPVDTPDGNMTFDIKCDTKFGTKVFGTWNDVQNTVSHFNELADADDGWLIPMPNQTINGRLHFTLYAPDILTCPFQYNYCTSIPNELQSQSAISDYDDDYKDFGRKYNAQCFYTAARPDSVFIKDLKISYYAQSNTEDILTEKDKGYGEDIEYVTHVDNKTGVKADYEDKEFNISTYVNGSDSTTFVMTQRDMTQAYDFTDYNERYVFDGEKKSTKAVNQMQEVKYLSKLAAYYSKSRLTFMDCLKFDSSFTPWSYFTTKVKTVTEGGKTTYKSDLFGTPRMLVCDSYRWNVRECQAEVSAKEIHSNYE